MKRIKILLVFLLAFLILTPVASAASADTLAGLRKELNALKAKKSDADRKTAQTRTEINNAKAGVFNSQEEIKKNQNLIDEAKIEIEALNIEIAKTEENIKKLMSAEQLISGDNIYLDYVFNAESYADLVYRYAIIEQVATHNKEQIESFEEKIDYNKKLQTELAEKEIELNKKILELEKNIASLGSKYSEITEITMDIKDEISSTQELINYLVKIGCKENENITSCMTVHGDIGFSRPLISGRITSRFGYRTHPVTGARQSWHGAVDIGGNPEGTNVYSSANGTVGKIVTKSKCGGNQVYVHHNIAGVLYTTAYFHLLDIKVTIGQSVTRNTVVGTIGGGRRTPWDGCSTGPHLHFVIAKGWYGTSCSGDCYSSYTTFDRVKAIDPVKVLNLPNSWTRR